jgi:predicted permease
MKDDAGWQRYWRSLSFRFRSDVDDEIAFHVAMRAAELETQGLDADAARREAQRRFGDRTQIRATLQRLEKKRGQRMRLSYLLQELIQDVRYGARGLLKRPGFTFMTASSLALGIAATTVVLSLIDTYLLRPLPVRDPGELVVIGGSNRASGGLVSGILSLPTVRDIAARTDLFQGTTATTMVVAATARAQDDPAERGMYLGVTGNYFSLLGVSPSLGRLLTPDDDRLREQVIVLSHRTWTVRFGGDPRVIGRTIRVNTVPFTVIGVTPRGFSGTEHLIDPDGYLTSSTVSVIDPVKAKMEERRDAGWFTVIARRQPSRTVAEVNSALGILAAEIEKAYPEVGEQFRLPAFAESRARPNLASAGGMLAASVVAGTLALLVLLTASVNATNLILARGSTRATELAVRQALGASRIRLISQLVTETLLLALLALAGGWVLARLAVGALNSIPLELDDLPLSWGLKLDLRVFGMTSVITLLIGLVAGVGPALSTSRFALQQRLREGGRAGLSRRGRRARSALVVAQVAASLVVLVCAGLFLASAKQAANVDLGFRPDHLLTFGVDATLAHYDEPTARAAFDRIRQTVEQLPGVVSAEWATTVPIKRGAMGMSETQGDGDAKVGLFTATVGPRYFEALEMPLLEGRAFEVADDTVRAGVVVINRRAAEALWPGKSALGRVVRLDRNAAPLEVVGVVKDSKYLLIGEAPRPYLYRPLAQSFSPNVYLHIRTVVDPAGLIGQVRSAVAAVDRELVPFAMTPMTDVLATSPNGTLLFKMGAGFASAIGLLALALTLAGLYGVIVYSVTQRTKEIGLRMALGATRWTVVRSILGDGGKLALIGIVIGIVGAVAISRMLGGLLVGSRGADAAIFAAVAIGLAAATLVSTYLPARRAARIDPVKALGEG